MIEWEYAVEDLHRSDQGSQCLRSKIEETLPGGGGAWLTEGWCEAEKLDRVTKALLLNHEQSFAFKAAAIPFANRYPFGTYRVVCTGFEKRPAF